MTISIHALLAESDLSTLTSLCCGCFISIHALLAESDCQWRRSVKLFRQFLSTLSLRRATRVLEVTRNAHNDFYPRSPCGERRWRYFIPMAPPCISIHALLAESDLAVADFGKRNIGISIHALLAESDTMATASKNRYLHFYPRSPCGERRAGCGHVARRHKISIHALLAESDWQDIDERETISAFLSTLSLRRATYESGLDY